VQIKIEKYEETIKREYLKGVNDKSYCNQHKTELLRNTLPSCPLSKCWSWTKTKVGKKKVVKDEEKSYKICSVSSSLLPSLGLRLLERKREEREGEH